MLTFKEFSDKVEGSSQEPLVLYHGDCLDGFTSAWLLNKTFPNAEFRGMNYGDLIPDGKNRCVVIADFSFPQAEMEQLSRECYALAVLDQHKTAEEDCQGLSVCTFDMNKSGAGLVLQWVEESIPSFFTGPQANLVAAVEDRDLWKFELSHTKRYHALLSTIPFDFKAWDHVCNMSFKEGDTLYEHLYAYQQKMIDFWLNQVKGVYRESGRVELQVNCGERTIISELLRQALMQSCLGVDALRETTYACGWYIQSDGSEIVSLRSLPNGPDVSVIAKSFGGGGHAHSAGYRIPKGEVTV